MTDTVQIEVTLQDVYHMLHSVKHSLACRHYQWRHQGGPCICIVSKLHNALATLQEDIIF